MTVDDVYQFMKLVAGQNQSGGIEKPDFERSYNAASGQYFDDLKGRFQNGVMIGRMDEEVVQKLSPFFIFNYPITFTDGQASKPSNLVHLEAMRYQDKEVIFLPASQLSSAINSVIDPPSTTGTIYATDAGKKYQIYPTSITSGVKIDYLRFPAKVVWNFTTDGDGRFQYTATGSTDPEWDDMSAIEIAGRALKLLSVRFDDQMLFAYAQQVKQIGS